MTDAEQRRYDMFIRVRRFGEDNAGDFPAGSVGRTQFDEIDAVIDLINQHSGDQTEGADESRFAFVGKDTARENLRAELYDISRTARSMNYQFPGFANQFRMPRSLSDQNLLAVGRAWFDETLANRVDFENYGLPATFRDELQAATDAFQTSLDAPGTSIDEQVAATAEIGAAVRRGMIAKRILDGVVKNKYRNNVGKLAAWLSASHVEKVAVENPRPKP